MLLSKTGFISVEITQQEADIIYSSIQLLSVQFTDICFQIYHTTTISNVYLFQKTLSVENLKSEIDCRTKSKTIERLEFHWVRFPNVRLNTPGQVEH